MKAINFFQRRSLKTRVTFFALVIFLIGMWSLAFYAARTLHADMERLVGEQQFSTVALVAAQVNEELDERLSALQQVVARVSPAMLGNVASLTTFLEDHPNLQGLFNGGIFATRADGMVVVAMPASAQRIGVDVMDRDYIVAAVKEGRAIIGRPVLDSALQTPVVAMAAPIRDATGTVIGALVGLTKLGIPNFLGQIAENRYGKTGGYVIAAPLHRLNVAATDKSRIMATLPAPGVNPMMDRYAQGHEGTDIFINPLDVEVLASVKGIPVAGWYAAVAMPTAEAFAPVHAVQQQVLLAAILLTLVAGGLTRWMLKRQLLPLLATTQTLADMAEKRQPLQSLPVTSQDEIGRLVTSFNSLLTTLKQQGIALHESEELYRTAFLTSPDAVNINRMIDGLYVQVNDSFLRMVGWTREEVIGKTSADISIWHNLEDRQQLVAVLLRDGYCENLEATFVTRDGGVLTGLMSAHIVDLNGERCILSVTRDISERKAAENQLRKLSLAVEQSSESIVITNLDAKIEYVNEAFVKNTGYSWDEAVGKNPRILHSGKTPRETYAALWESLSNGLPWRGEFYNQRKDGSEYVELAVITPIRQPDGSITHYVAVKEDITSKKEADVQINSLAFYDPLTGLPNRRLLLDRLKQALASSIRNEKFGALLFIDLDNFKTLNDTLGHDTGDLLLQQVARRLVTCVREGDTVARLGGDEFIVMLEHLSENAEEAATNAETVGENIRRTLNEIYQLASYTHHSTPSIGITLFTDHHVTREELLKRADLAMYQAKAAGRNTLRFFEPEMQAVVTARAALEEGLHEAVVHDQFVLHYQAQIDADGKLTGVEALLRWQHPQRGLVSPLEFISLAEETGLILPIGHWVLQSACAQLVAWADRPDMAHLTIAVNVSAREFHSPDFVDQVLKVLDAPGARPQRLKLELTESLLVKDIEGVITKMAALKARGVGFSLDDFGTGYSSLSYLKRLPLEQLKIDQGFVKNILADPNDAAIAKMVVALAESLNLAVIAEGVEVQAQRDFLADLGCHAYQGYLFSRPLPLAAFEEFVTRFELPIVRLNHQGRDATACG
jgi:diguanylate cyclase (GGDEF)-like protein/PAS domain S-box-containing protein